MVVRALRPDFLYPRFYFYAVSGRHAYADFENFCHSFRFHPLCLLVFSDQSFGKRGPVPDLPDHEVFSGISSHIFNNDPRRKCQSARYHRHLTCRFWSIYHQHGEPGFLRALPAVSGDDPGPRHTVRLFNAIFGCVLYFGGQNGCQYHGSGHLRLCLSLDQSQFVYRLYLQGQTKRRIEKRMDGAQRNYSRLRHPVDFRILSYLTGLHHRADELCRRTQATQHRLCCFAGWPVAEGKK